MNAAPRNFDTGWAAGSRGLGTADLPLSDPRQWRTSPGRTARPPAKPPATSTSPFTIPGLTSWSWNGRG